MGTQGAGLLFLSFVGAFTEDQEVAGILFSHMKILRSSTYIIKYVRTILEQDKNFIVAYCIIHAIGFTHRVDI